jgi:hypothetical protein
MKKNKVSWIILVSALSVACGGAGGPSGGESSGGAGAGPIGNLPTKTLASTVLSSVTLDSGETIEFRAYGPDRVGVVDTFRYGKPHAVPANAKSMTLSQVYSSIAPGKAVPAVLRDADQRLAAAKGAPQARIPPPPAVDSTPPSAAFYDFNDWFQGAFCFNAYCANSTGGFIVGPWSSATAFTAIGGIDGTALSSAELYVLTWDGTGEVATNAPASVPPGDAVIVTFYSNPTWYLSFLTPVDPWVEEDLAQQGATSEWQVLSIDSGGDNRLYTNDGDWAPTRVKTECGGGVDAVAGFSSIGAASCGLFGCSQERTTSMLCASTSGPLDYGSEYTVQCYDYDDRRDTSTGDWAVGSFKCECGPKDAIVGMAEDHGTGSDGPRVVYGLCAPIENNLGATNCQSEWFGQPVNTGFGGNGQETPNRGDWDPGFFKGECSPGRYVKGFAHDFTQTATFAMVSSGDDIGAILCCSPTTN